MPGRGSRCVYSLDHAVAHLHMVVTAREMSELCTVGGGGCSEVRSVRKCRAPKRKHRAGEEEEELDDYEHLDTRWKSGEYIVWVLDCMACLYAIKSSAYIVPLLTLSLLTKA